MIHNFNRICKAPFAKVTHKNALGMDIFVGIGVVFHLQHCGNQMYTLTELTKAIILQVEMGHLTVITLEK